MLSNTPPRTRLASWTVSSTRWQRVSVDNPQEEATAFDLQFHETLCTVSNDSRLLAAWNAPRAQIRLLILTHRILQPSDFRDHGIDFHRRPVSCLRQRDVTVGHQVLDEHLASSYRSVVEAICHNQIQPLRSSENAGEEREAFGG